MVGNLLRALATASASRRGKYLVLGVWLVLAGGLSVQAAKLPTLYDQNLTSELPASAPSQQALAFAQRDFPGSRLTPAILVLYDPQGINLADRRSATRIDTWLTSPQAPAHIENVVSVYRQPQAGSQLISPDGTAMVMVALLGIGNNDVALPHAVTSIREYLQSVTKGSGLHAYVTGPAGIAVDAVAVFGSADRNLLLGTVGLVLILLVVIYRSPILPLVPLFGVALVLVVVQGLLALAVQRGIFAVGQMPASIATVLLFGAGTDYTLFIAARYREELRKTPDRDLAIGRAMAAVAEAIASSGGTVLLSVLTLLLASLGLYNSLGWVLAIAMVTMLCAGLTLIPALLALLGRAAFWPFIPRPEPSAAASGFGSWWRIGYLVVRRPRLSMAFGLILLGSLALGSIGSEPSFSLLNAFRAPTDSRTGFDVLRAHMPPGQLDPTAVFVPVVDAYRSLAQIDAATAAASGVPGVAKVRSLTRPDGGSPKIPIAQWQTDIRKLSTPVLTGQAPPPPGLSADQRLAIGLLRAGAQYVATNGSAGELSVVFADDPYGLPAIHRIQVLRGTVHQALASAGIPDEVLVGGQTSTLADLQALSYRDTVLVVFAVLVMVGLVLSLLLRSLVAPLYLLGALALNFLAVAGLASFVFGRFGSGEGLNYAIPLYTFVFLVSLGADYTIFLMSRIREEAERATLGEAVTKAVGRTGGVISSAGLILAGTFSVLATLPLTVLFQLGLCVAVGVLMDTFVVRTLVVPSVVVMLGSRNWWPSRPNSS